MKDFIQAALPWVAMGIAIIIFVVNHNTKKQHEESKEEIQHNTKEKDDTYMTEGMAIGMCLGSSLGAAGVFNIGTGISIGMLLGLGIGSCIKKVK